MIISISLPDSLVNEIDSLEKQAGFSGRSDLIRTAVQNLQSEHRSKAKLSGTIDAILMIKHNEKYSEDMLKLRHKHEHLIRTHLHTHLENHHCLELFMLKGQADQIKKLVELFETSRKTELVKLNVL